MPDYDYVTVDVFTDTAFAGNQLAVFPRAGGLDDLRMQKIARELNLPETTFVLPPDDPAHTCRVRIFTPGRELPFAGHPTLGTAHVLAVLDPPADGSARYVFEEGVGPVPVDVALTGAATSRASLASPRLPESGPPPPEAETLAAILSVPADRIDGARVSAASCGVPFLFVPVDGLATIAAVEIDTALFRKALAGWWAEALFVYCRETVDASADIHARMFAPLFGIPEDPATGGAAAAFAGLLAGGEAGRSGSFTWRIEQGLEMGRPSLLEVEADLDDGRITAVRVGGASVTVACGVMSVPEA